MIRAFAPLLLAALCAAAPCTHLNKQPAQYVGYTTAPSLPVHPADDVVMETYYNHTAAIAAGAGIFAAQPLHFGKEIKIGGYYGTQAHGSKTKPVSYDWIFSIWDNKRPKSDTCGDHYDAALAPNATWCAHVHSFPLSTNCQRHCNDCGARGWDNSTGTQCKVVSPPQIEEGEGYRTRMHRVNNSVQMTFSNPNPIKYTGSVWRMEAQAIDRYGAAKGGMIEVGTMFFEDVTEGISHFESFHEHITCVPCAEFKESELRRGPFFADGRKVTDLTFTPHAQTQCNLWNVHRDAAKAEILFSSGPGVHPDN